MTELANRIRDQLLTAIDQDQLTLPTLPEVALKVRDIAEDDNATIQDISKTISDDAAMSARIIKVVNSPLFRGSREINTLNMAVSRLGMDYTSSLAMGLAMEQMFQATSDMVDRRLRTIWQRSTEIAGIAQVLAQHYTKLRPEQATLAGLVCQIGALPVLRFVEDHDLQVNSAMLDNLVDELHPVIGDRILKRWDFPLELHHVPSEHVNFGRQVPEADYADVVMVASLQTLVGTGHPYTEMNWHEVTAFHRLGLDPESGMEDDEDLGEQMDAAMALLKG
ncbi:MULTISPECIES: HDOD domain-containing protein [Gammaproteobacteria]|jgi:HD-like signal output (HDOD) protein|uniref:Histidine kinase n=2 Tax=Halomonadaceae TaxID=28256 RepID=A0A2A2F5X6_9GAMM|nr:MULTISPECIES: HDOD domain-containing protein [Gammaproteobacteria]KAA8978552.1 HDOD domain-containing protein [Halospina sp. K52047b]MYL26427.1 HDOD domain-containing protein [Halomonas utahensis]MYL73764.1 HDOD domain-containing protein [Halomonas sp. 22501_18_FS]PAU80077.1 histidine kinase [Halovibrio salipaludis]